jgi:DNA polymerase-4
VHSAMPMARAMRLCPQAVVLAPDFEAYRDASARIREIFLSVTPLVEPLALDEAFLDVGGSVRLLGAPPAIGALVRRRVRDELGLPCSVGVAPNKFLAKLCSAKAKPDDLLHLTADAADGFLAPLPVRDLWGVGEQTAAKLDRFAIRTVADVRVTPEPTLARLIGPAAARQVRALAHGRDERPVTPHEPAKGMSAEETFERDVEDPALLRRELLRLAERVAPRLRRSGLAARTVTLKLRYASFQTVTRSHTLDIPSADATVLHAEAVALLEALRLERVRVRLVGLAATNLIREGASMQLSLTADDRWSRLERAADEARDRFGGEAVTRGALLDAEPPTSGDAAAAREEWHRDAQ